MTDRGSPHGELIALQLAALGDPTSDRIIWLKKRVEHVAGDAQHSLEWRWGFAHGLSFDGTDPKELHRLLVAPVSRFLRKLVLRASPPLVTLLAELRRSQPRVLRCLRTLMIGGGLGDTLELDLGAINQLPSIQRLGIRHSPVRGRLDLPRLRELALVNVVDPGGLIANSDLPALERLEISSRAPLPMASWLAAPYVPSLRRLTLSSDGLLALGGNPQELFAQLTLFDQFVARTGALTTRILTVDRTAESTEGGLLVVIGGKRHPPGTLIRLSGETRLGSNPRCDIVLDGRHVLPDHATIAIRHRWQIESSGLTYVEGHQMDASKLRDDDEIAIGPYMFRFIEGDVDAKAEALRQRYDLIR